MNAISAIPFIKLQYVNGIGVVPANVTFMPTDN